MRAGGSRQLAPWFLLAALVAASAVARALAGLRIEGLWIAPDEMIYGSVGRSLWQHGSLSLFGEEPAVFGIVYPALIGLPLAVADPETGLRIVRVLQALVMSLTAVPVFFWARSLAGPLPALAAAALTLAVPGLAYSGLLMSEAAFYPVLVLAAWALAAALERPTPARQALLAGAVLLAAATRLQALVLPFVLVTAAALYALLTRDARRGLRIWPAVTAVAALGVGWLVYRTLTAGSPQDALGAYSVVGERGYSVAAVARFALYHGADLLLLTAVFPVCAVALLVLARPRSDALAAYLASAVSLFAWFLAVAGAFASEYVGWLAERTLLPLAPVLFVGFAAWLGRLGPRPTGRTAAVVLAALALLLYLPLGTFVVDKAIPDGFGLVPLLWLRERTSVDTLELVVWSGAAAALALFALLPRRALGVLPAIALGLLCFAAFASTREVQQRVAFDHQFLLGGEPRWIDETADQPVAYLLTSESEHNLVWQEVFWNERIRDVYVLAGAGLTGRVPPAESVEVRPDGRLVPQLREGAAVAPLNVAFRGSLARSHEILEYELPGLGLWALEPPARLSSVRSGVRWDGDIHVRATLDAYDCAGGRLELTLLPKSARRVELRVDGRLAQTLELDGEDFVTASVPAPAGARTCRFEVIPDALLGSTRFEFVRD